MPDLIKFIKEYKQINREWKANKTALARILNEYENYMRSSQMTIMGLKNEIKLLKDALALNKENEDRIKQAMKILYDGTSDWGKFIQVQLQPDECDTGGEDAGLD